MFILILFSFAGFKERAAAQNNNKTAYSPEAANKE